MNQKFNKKELERLGCNEEEIKLVMEYQKKLPIIVDNDEIELFCINARNLYVELRGSDTTNYSRWFSRAINNYKFYENVDFTAISPIGRDNIISGGDLKSKDYLLTIDMSKQLAMVEKSDIGSVARRYFLLMEKLVKKNLEWWATRKPEKANYIPMCEAISNSIFRLCGRYGDKYDFSREADIINKIATGSKAQSIRNYLGLQTQSELTRDSLEKDWNEKISFLQDQNMLLLGSDMKLIDRVKFLIQFFDVKYPNANPILPYLTIADMEKARKDILNELETR